MLCINRALAAKNHLTQRRRPCGRPLSLIESFLGRIVGEKRSSHLQLLRSIVGLDGFSLDDHGGVGFLPVLGLGGDGSGDVAGTKSEGCTKCRECGDEYGNNRFRTGAGYPCGWFDLLLSHGLHLLSVIYFLTILYFTLIY